jgi:single-stranded DNA-binding protein
LADRLSFISPSGLTQATSSRARSHDNRRSQCLLKCALFGSLGRDGELKQSKAGKAYLRLNVAVADYEATTWVSVTAFDPKAIENAAGFVKGSRVYAEGKLSQSEWIGSDGEKRVGLNVLSWQHTRLAEIGRARSKRERPKPTAQSASAGADDMSDEIPF